MDIGQRRARDYLLECVAAESCRCVPHAESEFCCAHIARQRRHICTDIGGTQPPFSAL